MVKVLIDLLEFLSTSLAILIVLFFLLSKSIRKHSALYYILFAIPFALATIPFITRMCGIETLKMQAKGQVSATGSMNLRDLKGMNKAGKPSGRLVAAVHQAKGLLILKLAPGQNDIFISFLLF